MHGYSVASATCVTTTSAIIGAICLASESELRINVILVKLFFMLISESEGEQGIAIWGSH